MSKFEVGQRVRDIGSEYAIRAKAWEIGAQGVITGIQDGLPYPVSAEFINEYGNLVEFLFEEDDELEVIDE